MWGNKPKDFSCHWENTQVYTGAVSFELLNRLITVGPPESSHKAEKKIVNPIGTLK